jgi:uncharacterized membrane protein YhiD involved in acid resistance
MGILIAGFHMYRNRYSKNFILTLALLPVIVQAVIMLVNGNVGTGVAVMGAFSLVRFRSLPGNSREIASLFLAMGVGLAAGMGYLGIGFILIGVIGIATILFISLPFGEMRTDQKDLKITIPENLDYNGLFDEVFEKYTKKVELVRVWTTNMGSLYELHYQIELKKSEIEKEFIDDLRFRNGNLNISCGRVAANRDEL